MKLALGTMEFAKASLGGPRLGFEMFDEIVLILSLMELGGEDGPPGLLDKIVKVFLKIMEK